MFPLLFEPILVIKRPKKYGIGTHWGVFFPDGRVVDFVRLQGVRFCTIEVFAEGLDVTIDREIPWQMALAVHERLEIFLQDPMEYNLFDWNCETFASWLAEGVVHSEQMGKAAFVGGAIAFVVAGIALNK